ncbi:MAG: CPBP family intramembrane metalloprotease, partial [Paramuribaculum sp.]|nr:CPBP family intramembrane metalloprotease [Paramuribaculum sp.]
LIISVIIIGVLAGVSEELFFRGTLQRLLITRPMPPHIAIWLTAVIFSLVHFQFFGFVPRVLLGAFFGYLAWWSGSVWLPAIIHAVNNSVVVITEFRGLPESLNQWGNGDTSIERIAVVISVMAVAVLAWIINRQASKQQSA